MLSEQEQIRRESLKKIINYGINPYPAKEFKFSHYSKQILENYIEGESVVLAGKVDAKKNSREGQFWKSSRF